MCNAFGTQNENEKMISDFDQQMVRLAYQQAKLSYDEGGLPIGAVLTRGETVISTGHNQRVQQGDPIAHGEMDCLRKAGRQPRYTDTTLYTSLSPCMMCSGTVVQFKIPRIVISDTTNFGGNEEFLRSNGVEVVDIADPDSIELMKRFIEEKPDLWNEDIME